MLFHFARNDHELVLHAAGPCAMHGDGSRAAQKAVEDRKKLVAALLAVVHATRIFGNGASGGKASHADTISNTVSGWLNR